MDISRLKLNMESFSNGGQLIVTNIEPAYRYENGKYTDTIENYKVEVVALGNGFEKFMVRVADKPAITEEMLGKAVVTFTDFEAKLYRNFKDNSVGVSAKAKAVIPVKQ